ncbi:MAG: hypothetical protein FWG19_03640 [Methanomassiliicoccaceae archaeon]|nr:hypothetical protein [Methanomassiliicoccaceae archaeon]
MDYIDKISAIKITKKDLPMLTAAASVVCFLSLVIVHDIGSAIRFVPLLLALPLLVVIANREKKAVLKAETIMNEAPTAVGMMRLMINGGRSLDSAVREIAESGPANIAKMFERIVWNVDTRISADIRDSLTVTLSELPDTLGSFKRSMYLLISASDSPDGNERKRMTKDADDTILEGLKEMGESYSSKLNAPCMVIFGLGVMIPMILVSILPMLSIGGQFSSASLDPTVIAFITLLVIPAAVAGVIMIIASKNPFYVRSDEKLDIRTVAAATTCVPSFLIVFFISGDLGTSMAAAGIACGSSLFIALYPAMAKEKRKIRTETSMGDALFDLGNRLLSGENFETALIHVFRERKECADLASSMERCLAVCRGDVAYAILTTMNGYSKKLASLYRDVFVSSQKDLRDAGRLAVSIAHQLQDQNAALNGIQNKLRSMLDMMTGTSSVFAPLILGVSVSMLAPLMNIAGGNGTGFTAPILIAYLIELALLISVLTTQLRCKGGIITTLYSFSVMMPVALVIFVVSSNLSI